MSGKIGKNLENFGKSVINLRSETQNLGFFELLEWSVRKFAGRIAFASSFGAEDQVIVDMLSRIAPSTRIFTLDTGRLPQATYDLMEATRKRYGMDIEVFFPDGKHVEEMVNKYGANLFYESIENRKLCCRVRKIEPLKRALAGLEAWICGLRQEQSSTRAGLEAMDWDETFGLWKICPLAAWSTEQVWEYIRDNDVPYNRLHDEGYPSIGCAPCTRAVGEDEDIRAGRWWWEAAEHKECGLHLHGEGQLRIKNE